MTLRSGSLPRDFNGGFGCWVWLLYGVLEDRYALPMSTITAVLEPDADGNLHLPVPAELRHGKVRVVATLQSEPDVIPGETRETPLAALKELRKLGGLRDLIPDPVAWQRAQRKERPLPGRD